MKPNAQGGANCGGSLGQSVGTPDRGIFAALDERIYRKAFVLCHGRLWLRAEPPADCVMLRRAREG